PRPTLAPAAAVRRPAARRTRPPRRRFLPSVRRAHAGPPLLVGRHSAHALEHLVAKLGEFLAKGQHDPHADRLFLPLHRARRVPLAEPETGAVRDEATSDPAA